MYVCMYECVCVCVCMVASVVWGNVYMHVCACVQEHSNSRRSPSRIHSPKWGLKLSSVCVKRARMCMCLCCLCLCCLCPCCLCPCVYVCMCVCMYACMYVCMYVCVCECCVGKCVYACVYACMCVRAFKSTQNHVDHPPEHTHQSGDGCFPKFASVCVCVCVCV